MFESIAISLFYPMERLLIRLIPFTLIVDWLVDFGVFPGVAGVSFKALHLSVGSIVLFRSGLPRNRGASTVIFGVLLILYSIGSQEIWSNLYLSVRSLYWIVVSLAIVQVISKSRKSFELFLDAIRLTIVVGSVATLLFMIGAEGHHNGSSYLLLWCGAVLVYFSEVTTKDKMAIGLSILAVIITIKRGAILSMTLMAIIGFIYIQTRSRLVVIVRNLFLCVLTLSAIFVFAEVTGSLEKLMLRLEDTSGSGRDLLYGRIINHYLTGAPHNWLLGFGVNSVQVFTKDFFGDRSVAGVQAHSDWLQMVHDFGLVGLLLMMSYVRRLGLIIRRTRKSDLRKKVASLSLLVLFLTSTTYSFILWDPSALVMAIYLNHVDKT